MIRSTSVIAVLVGVALVGCSSDEGAATDPTGATARPSVASTTVAESSVGTSVEATTNSTTNSSTVTSTIERPTAPTETIATVPEDGVPGIDSEDPFCRAWGEFAGSFQALTLASSLGTDAVDAARLEVVASPAVVSAAQALADNVPDPIAFERDTFVDGVIGPFARRSARAEDELRAAGLSSTDLEQLGDAWLTALADTGVDDPQIVVAVPAEWAGAVDAATAVFVADVPAIAADPSLVTGAAAPATFDYIAGTCPDQGVLGGNDAID